MANGRFEWRRWLGLLAGLYIAGLPTFYAIVELGVTGKRATHARDVGIVLFVVWGLVAVAGGYLALVGDQAVAEPSSAPPASDGR
jgi:hypothetical protein